MSLGDPISGMVEVTIGHFMDADESEIVGCWHTIPLTVLGSHCKTMAHGDEAAPLASHFELLHDEGHYHCWYTCPECHKQLVRLYKEEGR